MHTKARRNELIKKNKRCFSSAGHRFVLEGQNQKRTCVDDDDNLMCLKCMNESKRTHSHTHTQ